MMEHKQCPSCGTPWQDELDILARMIEQQPEADVEFLKKRAFDFYGHTESNPKYFGKNCVYKEFQGMYDGALAIYCEGCRKDFGRFSGKEIDYKLYTLKMEQNYYLNGEWK